MVGVGQGVRLQSRLPQFAKQCITHPRGAHSAIHPPLTDTCPPLRWMAIQPPATAAPGRMGAARRVDPTAGSRAPAQQQSMRMLGPEYGRE